MNELMMAIVAVLYAVIGSLIVLDAYFDFRMSGWIRKFFSELNDERTN